MAPPLIQLTDIHLTFGGHPLLEGVNLAVSAGERVCLVARRSAARLELAAAGIDWKGYGKLIGERPSAQRVTADRKAEQDAATAKKG